MMQLKWNEKIEGKKNNTGKPPPKQKAESRKRVGGLYG
jgi:hypothetical protein